MEKNILNQSSKIKDAIRILNHNKHKIAIVTDEKKRLIGTITNGDIEKLNQRLLKSDLIYIIVKNQFMLKEIFKNKIQIFLLKTK